MLGVGRLSGRMEGAAFIVDIVYFRVPLRVRSHTAYYVIIRILQIMTMIASD